MKPETKEKIKKSCKVVRNFAKALIETLVSALLVVILYVLYLPFGIGRAVFSRKAIRGFFDDVMWAIDGIGTRITKREEGEP